jgi:hypothetical protein
MKYLVTFTYTATVEVEAEDEQQAREIASDSFTLDQLEYLDTDTDEIEE